MYINEYLLVFNRKKYIDAVAGLMIVWMIFGHLQQVTGYFVKFPQILFFFMPWFYYKAGALHTEKPFYEIVNRGWQKFMKPFIVYGVIGQIILVICLLLENELSLKPYLYSPIRSLLLGGTIPGNTPLWFIPSIFITQCLYAFLYEKKVPVYVCAVIGFLGGLLLSRVNSNFIPVYFASGLFGMFFYAMGKLLHNYETDRKILVVVSIICCALLLIKHDPCVEIRYVASIENISIFDFLHGTIVALCGCILVNAMFCFLQPLLKFPILQFIGRNAMDFYLVHWIILIGIVRLVLGDLLHVQDARVQLVIAGIVCLIFIPFFIFAKNSCLIRN